VNGTGVIGVVGDAPNSLTYVKEQIAALPEVDTAVIQWGGACATCGTTDPAYGTLEFFAAWRAGAHAIIEILHSVRGPGGVPLQLAWVESPPMPADTTNPVSANLGTSGAARTALWTAAALDELWSLTSP
jgi:hypothetical protein